jgi:hypothetical protein
VERFALNFPDSLKGIDFNTIEESKHTIYVIDRELKIIYVNEAWVNFAIDNQGKEYLNNFVLGTSVLDAISGDAVKLYYQNNYRNVLQTGKMWNQEYECSSPEEYRIFRQSTLSLKDGKGLCIINALAVHLPMHEKRKVESLLIEKEYRQASGFITQCSNCRQVQRVDKPDVWDWLPQWVEKVPKNMSHSFCAHCYDYHWKYGSLKYDS